MTQTSFSNHSNPPVVSKIVTGGQTGVDRAGLDAAIELGIPCGGWCPQGRRAEDGVIPAKYPLQETEGNSYNKRTKLNVRDSDGTLILNRGELDGGTAHTLALAKKLRKPFLIVDLDTVEPCQVAEWLDSNKIRVLNVAGPREGKRPGVYSASLDLLLNILSAKKSV